MVQELLAQDLKGIAISPIDPDNQPKLLAEIASRTNLITHDSDAPKSKRLWLRRHGQLRGRPHVRQARQGGAAQRRSVMIFVGRLGQDNAKHRRQGVIDELLGRDHDATRYDEPGECWAKAESM